MAKDIFEPIAVRYMTDLIRDFDLEDFQAAGFPGNFGVESTGFTDVTENNPSSGVGGLGHAQWTGRTPTNNRRLLFEQYIEKRRSLGMSAAPDDYETNYGMVFRELDGTEGRRVLPKLRLARNVDEAVEIVMTEYERPGILHLDKRKEYGRRALAAFRAAGIDAAELRRQERPGAAAPATDAGTAQAANDPIQQIIQQAIAALMPRLMTALVTALSGASVAQQPPPTAPTAPPTEPAAKPGMSDTAKNWSTGILGALLSLTASKFGVAGDPVGPAATTTGFLGLITPLIGSALGAYAPILNTVGPLLSRVIGAIKGPAK
jgi:hypothetical protein